MKNILTLIAALFIFVGCAENPIASNEGREGQKIEMKNVEVQIKYNGKATEWNAYFMAVDMGDTLQLQHKAARDTNSFNLGNYHTGAKIRIMYGNGANYDPDLSQINPFLSIHVKIGDKDTTVYGVEGLYTTFIVK